MHQGAFARTNAGVGLTECTHSTLEFPGHSWWLGKEES
jgi:hypothetical protein